MKTVCGNLPPGKYYIGDPCYVIGDEAWKQLHIMMFPDSEEKEGIFELNGHKLFIAGTMYGDGTYEDTNGIPYGVDSGCLGLVPEPLCERTPNSNCGGMYVTFEKELSVARSSKGFFLIGNKSFDITISTDYLEEE